MKISPTIHSIRVDAGQFKLTKEFVVTLEKEYRDKDNAGNEVIVPAGTVITVPVGYFTDFATVPRFFRRAVPQDGKHSPAALLHDWLYDAKKWGAECFWTRKIADEIFRDAMEALGVKWWRRGVMYWAVRINWFGAGAGEYWQGGDLTNT